LDVDRNTRSFFEALETVLLKKISAQKIAYKNRSDAGSRQIHNIRVLMILFQILMYN
jgi:hypothetical protein